MRSARWIPVVLAVFVAPGSHGAAQEVQPFVMAGATSAYVRDALKTETGWTVVRDGQERRWGFVVGVGAKRRIFEWLSLRGELELVRRGFSGGGAQLRMTYLEVPLLLEAAVPLGGGRHLLASVGGTAGREVSCYAEATPPVPGGEGAAAGSPREEDCRAFRTRRTDVGLAAGVGYGPLAVLGTRITPEARLVVGQLNLAHGYAACCRSHNRSVEVFVTVAR